MNVFSNTKKSISFFLNMFNNDKLYTDNIKQFIEQEYRPIDRSWASYEIKNRKDKPTTLMFK